MKKLDWKRKTVTDKIAFMIFRSSQRGQGKTEADIKHNWEHAYKYRLYALARSIVDLKDSDGNKVFYYHPTEDKK